jgi:hypothetical protein
MPQIKMMYQFTKSCRVVLLVSKASVRARKNTWSKQYQRDNTFEMYRNYVAYVSPVQCKSGASGQARRGSSW